MTDRRKVYLALGDSMSIDEYTGVIGGGAVRQFHECLGQDWILLDRTCDGCTIAEVPTGEAADLITLTIGGNDALAVADIRATEADIAKVVRAHRALLLEIRKSNPLSLLIVGNIYRPDSPLPENLLHLLRRLNRGIEQNVRECGGALADISGAFDGHESEYLCRVIEPNLKGAAVIAGLFRQAYESWAEARDGSQ
ncbi:MAG TPA: GDSL-type esterase/lipase family protein [candidate division Zixibacteria bacterium]|nr:hypothetical protein [candidate division Zixibacteria bacterium]MDD4916943.1 GDSL-type esterase/lipase family protein [candidate division Zixibacteria bacterium]MDM7973058.1 GDSL-type esterase/lipase family protein [candidate division Zixibacteria bacterium]HOD67245.1 GDSL-type esterase/lipase family protein [candidate division Zixibacteria bacterium]HOZ08320.1 GDSL-type esterase/lipase family protein [candidate division Zixibacteria bacterium]